MGKTSKTEYIVRGEIQEKSNASPYNVYCHIYPHPQNDKEAFEEFKKIVLEMKRKHYRVVMRLIKQVKQGDTTTESMLT